MRGHSIRFHSEIRKIIFELSSIIPLIWNSELAHIQVNKLTLRETTQSPFLPLLSVGINLNGKRILSFENSLSFGQAIVARKQT